MGFLERRRRPGRRRRPNSLISQGLMLARERARWDHGERASLQRGSLLAAARDADELLAKQDEPRAKMLAELWGRTAMSDTLYARLGEALVPPRDRGLAWLS